jgi:hypothetical protein
VKKNVTEIEPWPKAMANITNSLRDSGTVQGKKPNPCQQLNPN